MDSNNSKSDPNIKDASVARYKAVKRPSAETDNPFFKMLDSIVSGLEGLWANVVTYAVILIVEH